MLIIYLFFFVLFVFVGVFSFISKRNHLLSTLLRLEFLVLRLFFYLFVVLVFCFYDLYFLIYFLTFRVCEGALGLSVLVSIIRRHGRDYFTSFNIVQC